jgi:hypothetical protein
MAMPPHLGADWAVAAHYKAAAKEREEYENAEARASRRPARSSSTNEAGKRG